MIKSPKTVFDKIEQKIANRVFWLGFRIYHLNTSLNLVGQRQFEFGRT